VGVRIWYASSVFTALVNGWSVPAGYAVTKPAVGASVMINMTAIAVASAGTGSVGSTGPDVADEVG